MLETGVCAVATLSTPQSPAHMAGFRRCLRLAMVPVLASLLVVGCASGDRATRDLSTDTPAHRGVLIVQTYEHEIKAGGGLQRQIVENGWDYDRAVAIERVYTLDRELISERDTPGVILRATDKEMETAVELVKQHPDLAKVVSADGAAFEGGFIHMKHDEPDCDLQSRCVYVVVSLDNGRRKIAQAIVDLQTARVVDPRFDPIMIDD